jgi:hypothetical protein
MSQLAWEIVTHLICVAIGVVATLLAVTPPEITDEA